jgi:hypothetical protein
MRELEGYARRKEDGSLDTVAPYGGWGECDYHYPDESLSGCYCYWGYQDPFDRVQCEHFQGVVERVVKVIELEDGTKDEIKHEFILCSHPFVKANKREVKGEEDTLLAQR